MTRSGGWTIALAALALTLAPAHGLALTDTPTTPEDQQTLAWAEEILPHAPEHVPTAAATLLDLDPPPPRNPLPPGPVAATLHENIDDPDWLTWLLELDTLRRTLAAHAPGDAPLQPRTALAAWDHALDRITTLQQTAPPQPGPTLEECGLVRVDGVGDDSHVECDHLLDIDLGGDDTYHNNAGGSLPPMHQGPSTLAASQAGLLVDLAGNDTYTCTVQQGACTGGGHGAAGAHIDLEGDDTYEARGSTASVNGGGGYWGLGLLVNAQGNDTIHGHVDYGGVNGGAAFGGAGLLIDAAGDDEHTGEVRVFGGVNGGANDGFGMLADLAGSDTRDGSVGQRGGVNGGGEQAIGMLFDAGLEPDVNRGTVWGGGVNGAGNGNGVSYAMISEGGGNTYAGSVTNHGAVNGASSYAANALLVDLSGGARYEATIEGPGAANGATIGGEALLASGPGDDVFEAFVQGAGAANGAAHHGVGVLANVGGENAYRAVVEDTHPHGLWGSGAAQNGGSVNGIGLLVDPGRDGFGGLG